MGLVVVTPATTEPVTLVEAKAHLRVRHSEEDTYITSLIKAATRHIEKVLDIALITQTFRYTLDAFEDEIELPRGPVASITSVKYLDVDGVEQTVLASEYVTDLTGQRARVMIGPTYEWPDTLEGLGVVRIQYVAGSATLPDAYQDLKWSILLIIAHFYFNRGDGDAALPPALLQLIQSYRPMFV